jgi:phage-related protein
LGEAIGLFANETQMAAWAGEELGLEWKTLDEAGKQVARLEFAQAMQESAGATGQAARESDSLSNQLGNVKSAFGEFAGTVMEPLLDPLINGLKSATDWLTNATGGVEGFQKGWDSFKEALPYIAVGIGTIVAALIAYNMPAIIAFATTTLLTGATTAFGAAVAFLTSPITLVIVAIGLLVGVLIYLYKNNETVRNAIDKAWAFIKNTISSVVSAVSSFVMSVWGTLTSWWKQNNELIKQTAQTIWNAIKKAVKTVMDFLGPFIKGAWNTITTVIKAAWNLIKSVVETGIKLVLAIIKAVMQAINGDWKGAWNTIKSALKAAWDSMVSAISSFVSKMSAAVKKVMDAAWKVIKNMAKKFFEAGKNIVSSIADGIKSAVGKVTGAISGIASKVRGFLPFSPAKEGPLDDIHRLNFGGPIEDSIKRAEGGVQNKLAQMLALPQLQPFDIAGSVQQISAQAQRKLSLNGSMNIERQPAYINLSIGGRDFSAFVSDITSTQDQHKRLSKNLRG